MALVKSINGLNPKWGEGCYFSENATIVGEVTMGRECSVWFNAVLRADVAPITMGDAVNVQDGACIHVTNTTGPVAIGNNVSIGHNATVHACTIRDGALVGMGATLLDGCDVGEGAIVAAGALVLQGTKIGPHEIWGGRTRQVHQAHTARTSRELRRPLRGICQVVLGRRVGRHAAKNNAKSWSVGK